jgi:hypothetical protein
VSDQTLSDLERRWRTTDAIADEAVYLLERVRVGDLARERLDLAAYCGHEGAALILAGSGEATPPVPETLTLWIDGLRRWGLEVSARAAVALYALELRRSVRPRPKNRKTSRALLESARDWLECPCEEHLDEVRRKQPFDAEGMFLWAYLVNDDAFVHGWQQPPTREDWLSSLAGRIGARVEDELATLAAVRAELLPWVLGRP